MRQLFFLILFALFFLNGKAQERMFISGRVTELESGSPLPGASVVIKGTNKGCICTPNGYFRLIIPSDTVTVLFSFIGYETKVVCLRDAIIGQPIIVSLKSDNTQLEEVKVISEKERIVRVSDSEVGAVSLSPRLVEKLPSFGEVDVSRSFQLLPGISASNETSSGLYVCGGTPDQNLILFDGMTIYHVDHFYGFFSAFNASSIEDVKLYKGWFPAKYGGRLSSVMELQGRSADISQFDWSGSLSLLSVDGMLEIPLIKNKLSFQISGRRSYSDVIKSGLFKSIFDLYDTESSSDKTFSKMVTEVEPTFNFYDLNSKLTWFASDRDEVVLALYNGRDFLDNSRNQEFGGSSAGATVPASSTTTSIFDELKWGNLGYSLQWKRQWNKFFGSQFSASHSNYFSQREQGTENSQSDDARILTFDEDNNVEDLSISLDNEWKPGKSHIVGFGARVTQNKIDYQYALASSLIDLSDDGIFYSAYLQDKYNVSDKLDINVGARLSYFDVTRKNYFEPRLSIAFRPAVWLRWSAGWGTYNQFVSRTTRDNLASGSSDFWMLAGVNDVPVASSSQYQMGLAFDNTTYHLGVEGFYRDLNGISEFSGQYTTSDAGQTSLDLYSGTGIAKGVEFMAQKKAGDFTGWVAYTLGGVVYNFPGLNNGNDFYASHDQRHELKMALTESYRNLDFSLIWIFATGMPYTAPEGVYTLETVNGQKVSYIHLSDKNACRLPNYHRMDFSVNYNFYIGNARSILGFSVFNLYNHQNIWYKEFEIDESTGKIVETDIYKLGFTPNITFKVYLR